MLSASNFAIYIELILALKSIKPGNTVFGLTIPVN